jgi:hypothetical protein
MVVNINDKKEAGVENITCTTYGELTNVGFCTGADILRLANESTMIDGYFYFGSHIGSQTTNTFQVVQRSYEWRYTESNMFGGSGTQYLLRNEKNEYEHLSYNGYFCLPANPLVRVPSWAA